MLRFNVNYFIGKNLRHTTIEAETLEGAEQKANQDFKSWVDVSYCDIANAEPAYLQV